jgi:integrase
LFQTLEFWKAENVVVSMKDLQPLRTFEWLLLPAQLAKVQEWLGHANIATTRIYERRRIGQRQPSSSASWRGGAAMDGELARSV